MSETRIEWTDATWNPTTGCSKVSPGCTNCYAERMSLRFGWSERPWSAAWAAENVVLHPERLTLPLHWRKPRRVFVNSMSDLFHERVPDEFIRRVWAVMDEAERHVFQILTKRPERMAAWLAENAPERGSTRRPWPLSNVWLGTSVEDQRRADERIPHLLRCPAAVRFLSCEPLLGPVDVTRWLHDSDCCLLGEGVCTCSDPREVRVDWVIAGGESGPGARPMHPDWLVSLRDQCAGAGVPWFFKQWGEWLPNDSRYGCYQPAANYERQHLLLDGGVAVARVGKQAAGALLDGRLWREMPGAGVRA